MAREGIYYLDPMPVQRGPGVPIPAQGDQPPFTGKAVASFCAIVSSSWVPADPIPQGRQDKAALLGIVYGSQPPPFSSVTTTAIVGSWQPPDPLPQGQQKQTAPLALIYGDKPPAIPTSSRATSSALAWQSPDPPPQGERKFTAPLAITYGDSPPPYSSSRITSAALAWLPADPLAQGIQDESAAFGTVLVAGPPPYSPVPMLSLIGSWQPADPIPQGQQKLTAPLALIYGNQPPSRIQRIDALAWIPADPIPQRQSFVPIPPVIASANPPPSNTVLLSILASWTPIDTPAQGQQKQSAPLSLSYGDQPPPLRQRIDALSWVPVDQPVQRIPLVIPVPPIVSAPSPTSSVRLFSILTSWLPPDPAPQGRQDKAALLPIVYGSQPPPYSTVRLVGAIEAWRPVDPLLIYPRWVTAGVSAPTVLPTPTRIIRLRGVLSSPIRLRGVISSPIRLRGSLAMPAPTGLGFFHQGEATSLIVAVDPLTPGGSPPVLTGMTLVCYVYDAVTGSILLTLTPTPDVPVQGSMTINLSHAQTAAMALGSYPFEVHRTDPGFEKLVANGAVDALYSRTP